jgi:hypothetical protein
MVQRRQDANRVRTSTAPAAGAVTCAYGRLTQAALDGFYGPGAAALAR